MYNQQVVDNIVTLATIPEIGQNERLMIAAALLNNLQILPGSWSRMAPNQPVNNQTKQMLIGLMRQHDNIPDAVAQQLPQTKRTIDNLYETMYLHGGIGREKIKAKAPNHFTHVAGAYGGGDVGWDDLPHQDRLQPIAPRPSPGAIAADWLARHNENREQIAQQLDNLQRDAGDNMAARRPYPALDPPGAGQVVRLDEGFNGQNVWVIQDDLNNMHELEMRVVAQQQAANQARAQVQAMGRNTGQAFQLQAAGRAVAPPIPAPPEEEYPF